MKIRNASSADAMAVAEGIFESVYRNALGRFLLLAKSRLMSDPAFWLF
jgi:hypothetical protein